MSHGAVGDTGGASRSVLIIIGEDPRSSHRANEALRIALGIAAGETPVRVVLLDGAVHLLDEDTDDLIDGEDIARFRASLKGLDVPVHVEVEAIPGAPSWNPDRFAVQPVSWAALAAFISSSARSMVF